MPQNSHSGMLIYALSIVTAMMLRIMPFPPTLENFNPDWVLLVLIYWSLAIPERFGVFNAWSVGLLVDVLTGRLLGQFALIYSLVCYFAVKLHKRIRHYPIPQQSLFVFFCLLLGQLIIFWIESMQGTNQLTSAFWFPVISGTLLWPAVYYVLRLIRALLHIA
ncbi:rod shape-determining protein MreD [Methylomarinum sp. Ch1-1]|uniref:Rod shape-determining protein MreD n=1 Tax=Methylomarinum roseum TaxID=3067653 RepID=A0AAU7NVA4_9GAMM|nr:rod shape-determining protein MreD [Methylomarinum sp. Ch1-1]MDP4519021.1 rod shape-determining protein MreD [Methylomarinum sp. Ch1-1]